MENLNTELSKLVIRANPDYNLQTMGGLRSVVENLDEKVQESFFKRSKAMVKHLDTKPYDNWFLGIGHQLSQIGKMVSDAVLSIYPNGAPKQYVDTVVFELAGYQTKNIKKICDYVVKNYNEHKALPTLSFWLDSITAVKSSQPIKNSPVTPLKSQISKEEQAEVKQMMRSLCESFGATTKKEGSFHNKTTLIRCYGILQNLNKGLKQAQTIDGKDYEWVNEWEVGEREVIDHSKVLEMFNSGRVSEKEAREAWEKELG